MGQQINEILKCAIILLHFNSVLYSMVCWNLRKKIPLKLVAILVISLLVKTDKSTIANTFALGKGSM